MTTRNAIGELASEWPRIPWAEDLGVYYAEIDTMIDTGSADVPSTVRFTVRISAGSWWAHVQLGGFWFEEADHDPVSAFRKLVRKMKAHKKYLSQITEIFT